MTQFNSTLKTRVPQIRCYKCGDEDIVEICHHCGRAMCEAHKQPHIPWWLGGKHAEFSRLGLKNHPATAVGRHCEDCFHMSLSPFFWVPLGALLFGLFGLVVSWGYFNLGVLGVVVLTTAFLFLGGLLFWFWVYTKNQAKRRKYGFPLPAIGQLRWLKFQEEIRGTIVLDLNGMYQTTRPSMLESGRAEFNIKFDSLDKDRILQYRQRHQLVPDSPLPTQLGYLVLNGRPNVTLRSNGSFTTPQKQAHTIALQEDARDIDFLMGRNVGLTDGWTRHFDYTFKQLPPAAAETLPAQIIPRVVWQGNRWSLELLVQITPGMNNAKLLDAKVKINELSLFAPSDWGEPESPNGGLIVERESNPTATRQLIWRNVTIDKAEADSEDKEEKSRKKIFVVRFGPGFIPQALQNGNALIGKLDLRFDYAFSGIESLSYFYPTGKQADLTHVKKELYTNVEIKFHLHLNKLCFQRPYARPVSVERNNTPPDYQLIRRLNDALAHHGGYVQQLIETSPRTSPANAKHIGRFWHLEGRKYEGAFPIDFHLDVKGLEKYEADAQPATGCVVLEAKVFAMIFNRQMKQKVDTFADLLARIFEDVIDPGGNQTTVVVPNPPSDPPSGPSPVAGGV